jgi:AcrR family transcriptional regulator
MADILIDSDEVAPRGIGGRAAYLERRRAATRNAILLAARRVFADASYADAKIDDIIGAAGVSRATFYSHFESKLELACAIYEEIVPQTRALFARLPGLAGGDRAAVRAWLDAFVGSHLEHRYVTPLIAQLQLFESQFRARILRDTEVLIDLVAASGAGGFAAAASDARQRVRVRLLFNRVANVCAEVARGEFEGEAAEICLDLVGEEILGFFNE